MKTRHPTTIRRMLQSRLKKLQATGTVLAASLVTIDKQCGRANCRCQRGEKHRGHYITYKEKGKTRTVYVPLDMIKEVRSWIEEHRRMKKLSQEISQLAIEQIRTHVTERRRKEGKS